MFTPKRIFLAGHNGMVGKSFLRNLPSLYPNSQILTADKSDLDLRDKRSVDKYFKVHQPELVVIAAAKVGGIYANDSFPVDFLMDNLSIQNNIISLSHKYSVERLLFLGSSCIYPKNAKNPIEESQLLSGYLEPTNEPYALAKISGIKLCEAFNKQYGTDYRAVMPSNLYGPGDNYHLENSHVIPALVHKMHLAKENNLKSYKVWGTGKPRREFLYVDDLIFGCMKVLSISSSHYKDLIGDDPSIINIGASQDITIKDLAKLISRVVAYEGMLDFDETKPDGTMQKLMSSKKISSLNWRPNIDLQKGLELAYDDFLKGKYNKK